MASLDWQTAGEGGVTLVHLLVTSEVTERVRVANCLDGPVWPPRSRGVPEAGWDDDGFEGVVAPDDRLVLGYASPAEPATPPARIASADPVADGDDAPDEGVTARDVVRTLGDPTPPRDAVATAERTGSPETADGGAVPHDTGRARQENAVRSPEELPEAVSSYFEDVARRLEDAERLASVSSVPEATAAVDEVGAGDVSRLERRLDADRDRLERLAERSESLAARIEGVEVPVEALRRLA